MEGISVGTGGQNKVINWDVNVSRAGFEEEKKFRSGPAPYSASSWSIIKVLV